MSSHAFISDRFTTFAGEKHAAPKGHGCGKLVCLGQMTANTKLRTIWKIMNGQKA